MNNREVELNISQAYTSSCEVQSEIYQAYTTNLNEVERTRHRQNTTAAESGILGSGRKCHPH
jgi:hypothetical protein